jgi:hypothetical protein
MALTLDEFSDCWQRWHADVGRFQMLGRRKRLSDRRDAHALVLLSRLVPDVDRDEPTMIQGVGIHGELWISTECAELRRVITPAQCRELIWCGVRYDADLDQLYLLL